ncbi:MAG: hypothetical protein OZ913_02340 [Ignavibacteriaceae bacterium]|jgi:hypothetical protein|nr:MAG: hypothetical protein EDM69_05565 [Chlorobiota bacterium]KXK06043.1 MAG: hypothetical protein UZ04_CHB001000039 [Chlorobi bacterium OLB4]MBV6398478.1 hypothetical protein [Ignavibacteria bacterium]MCC6885712.1 hypothetical protein [Ignavibacteriales bacterium]MCE7953093.1 hypothetical protein [Chlorobi bacterium CHB7]MDL1887069.1 hypothetical protein [Ignavibacteria bacterium CHB1]MEB2329124.1 hypothetical protein [Ignavibacteriaceae bacterium]OQY77962.1 MAG: hypothetical protein B6D4
MKIFSAVIIAVILTGCSSEQVSFDGKVYTHQTDSNSQVVGFDDGKIYFTWDDDLGKESFTTGYRIEQMDDSTFKIILDNPNPYMQGVEWVIISKDGESFYSKDSGKKYSLKKQDGQ